MMKNMVGSLTIYHSLYNSKGKSLINDINKLVSPVTQYPINNYKDTDATPLNIHIPILATEKYMTTT